MMKQRQVLYAAAAPTCDYDRDGRLDLLLATWWEETRPLLLRNETRGGRWLQVAVAARGRVNRQGVGARVRLYAAGRLGQPAALLGDREISLSHGWCSGHEAVVHFGLADRAVVDVEVRLPHGRGTRVLYGVQADQRIVVAADGSAPSR